MNWVCTGIVTLRVMAKRKGLTHSPCSNPVVSSPSESVWCNIELALRRPGFKSSFCHVFHLVTLVKLLAVFTHSK